LQIRRSLTVSATPSRWQFVIVRILVLIMILLFAAAMTAFDARAGTALVLVAASIAIAMQVDSWLNTPPPSSGHKP
jgi:hypothetical protein